LGVLGDSGDLVGAERVGVGGVGGSAEGAEGTAEATDVAVVDVAVEGVVDPSAHAVEGGLLSKLAQAERVGTVVEGKAVVEA